MKFLFISKHPGIYPAVLKAVRTCYRNVLCPKLIERMNLRLASPADNPAYNKKTDALPFKNTPEAKKKKL